MAVKLRAPRVNYSVSSLTGYLRSLSITTPWGGRASMTLSALQHENLRVLRVQDLVPNPVRHHDGTAGSTITPMISVVGGSSDLPAFIGQAPNWDLETAWGLTDISGAFDKTRLNLRDVLPAASANAHALLAEILTSVGITEFEFEFENFQVSQIRLSNELLWNVVDRILRVRQAVRFWRGNKLIMKVYSNSGSTWVYNSNNIHKFSRSMAQPIPANQFTVTRVERQKSAGPNAEFNCIGGQCVGRTLDVTFDEPVGTYNCRPTFVNQGVLELFQNYDEDGNLIPGDPGPGIYAGPILVKRVTAIYHPQYFGSIAGAPMSFTPGYGGQFIVGNKPIVSDDEEFTYVYPPIAEGLSEHQTEFGIIPDEGAIDDPIVRDEETMRQMAQAMYSESVRKTYTATLESPFINPRIREGDFARVSDANTNTNGVLFFVESVTTQMNPEWMQILQLTRATLA